MENGKTPVLSQVLKKEGVRLDYQEFVFDAAPENLRNYTLRGDFYTAASRIDGNWRITFPLENAA